MGALSNDIRIGSTSAPSYRFSNASIALNSLSATMGVDVIGNELSIDTFTFTVRHVYDKDQVYAPRGKKGYRDTNSQIYRTRISGKELYVKFVPADSDALVDANNYIFRTFYGYAAENYLNLPYGTPVWWYVGGTLFAKGYTKSVDRVGKYAWKVTCVSGVGLLDTKMHGGGIYNGVALSTIARSIIGSTFLYTVSEDLASVLIYGHLPYDTARNNLHRLLFAVGASLVRGTGNIDYSIQYLDSTEIDVPSSRIALGGSISTQLPANSVEVTEYAFIAGTDESVLFDNTSNGVAADSTIVTFGSPMHSLVTTGNLVINESSVNYAVVTGTGTLTGKNYIATERVVTLSDGDGEQRVKRVKDNHLISFANSLNVAQRVLDYYSTARTLKAKLMLEGEKTGNNLLLADAFGEIKNAFLSKMNVSVTTVKAAQCELIEGYTPKHGGNNYDKVMVITRSRTVKVPSTATQMRVVLISGAQGGQGGYDGMDGSQSSTGSWESGDLTETYEGSGENRKVFSYPSMTQRLAKGGDPGARGEAGRILISDVSVTPGESIAITIGRGGAGGARNGGVGAMGDDTIAQSTSIGVLSTANGTVSDAGYYDVQGDVTYGGAGVDGHAGGDGGQVNEINLYANQPAEGLSGGSVGFWKGGAGSQPYLYERRNIIYDELLEWVWASGGGGGGAAWGSNGNPGHAAYAIQYEGDTEPRYWVARTGAGGAGANAVAPSKADYGVGGSGGNGGGGGGNMGGGEAYSIASGYDIYTPSGRAKGGKGSIGGRGGDGICIIYYS